MTRIFAFHRLPTTGLPFLNQQQGYRPVSLRCDPCGFGFAFVVRIDIPIWPAPEVMSLRLRFVEIDRYCAAGAPQGQIILVTAWTVTVLL